MQVSDTGIGLPEDAQEWLFKLFSQGDSSTTRQFGGSGIGLVICQQLVTQNSTAPENILS
jgi:two-component system sensor histidine kinase BarA